MIRMWGIPCLGQKASYPGERKISKNEQYLCLTCEDVDHPLHLPSFFAGLVRDHRPRLGRVGLGPCDGSLQFNRNAQHVTWHPSSCWWLVIKSEKTTAGTMVDEFSFENGGFSTKNDQNTSKNHRFLRVFLQVT